MTQIENETEQNTIQDDSQTPQSEEAIELCHADGKEASGLDGNRRMLESFIKSLAGNNSVSEVTKRDYAAKLNKLMKQVIFDSSEEELIEFLSAVENPNTRSNKCYTLIKVRTHANLPCEKLASYRDGIKSEITMHRKTSAKENLTNLMSYGELEEKLRTLTGVPYLINFFFVYHGLRNKDINVKVFHKKPKEPVEGNYLVWNPKAKKPKATMVITDYKTSKVYGDKEFVITDARFIQELAALNLKSGQPLITTRDGKQATNSYLGVLAARHSINRYGEGKIAKILVKHCIDTKQFDRVQQLSEQRGTSMGQLYTSYNVMDCK